MQFVKSNSKNKYILTFLVLILSACNLQSNNSFGDVEQKVFTAPQCTENTNSDPTILFPRSGRTSTLPKFEWDFPSDCVPIGFRLQIGEYLAPVGDFVFDEEIGSNLFYQMDIDLLPSTVYWWRVQVLLEPGAANISDFAKFVTGPNCTDVSELKAPILITPANNSIVKGKFEGSHEIIQEFGYPNENCLPDGFYTLISDNPEFTGINYSGVTGGVGRIYSSTSEFLIFRRNQSDPLNNCTTYYMKEWGAMGEPAEIGEGGGLKGPESKTITFYVDFGGNEEGECDKFDLNTEFETSLPAIQITPTVTPTAEIISIVDPIPPATADEDANCRSGPGIIYSSLAFFLKGKTAEILGQNILHDWVFVKLTDDLNCWVWEGALTEDSVFENSDEFPDPPTPTFTPSPTLTPTPTSTLTPAPVTGSISGTVFRDANSDGNNSGDVGHPGATVTLGTGACNSSGLASTSSNGSGGFSFTGLSAGTYCLTISPPVAASCPRWDVATTNTKFTINLSAGQSVSKIIGFDNSACSID